MKLPFDNLIERGFISQVSDEIISKLLNEEKITIYVGFDPTSDSLHLGHLVPLFALSHLQQAGHNILIIVGGATGMIGDPSGKSEERNLITPDEAARNIKGLKRHDFCCIILLSKYLLGL